MHLKFFHKIIDICCDMKHNNEQQTVQNHLQNQDIFVDKFVPSLWPTESVFQDVCQQFVQLLLFLGCQTNDLEKTIEQLGVNLFNSLFYKISNTLFFRLMKKSNWFCKNVLKYAKKSSTKQLFLKQSLQTLITCKILTGKLQLSCQVIK